MSSAFLRPRSKFCYATTTKTGTTTAALQFSGPAITVAARFLWVYINTVEIEFDPAKNATNVAKHGVSLQVAEAFDWNMAFEREDDRFDDGKVRFVALGPIGDNLCADIGRRLRRRRDSRDQP